MEPTHSPLPTGQYAIQRRTDADEEEIEIPRTANFMRSLEFRDALECPQLDAAGLRNPGEAERVPFRGLMAAVDRSGKYVKNGQMFIFLRKNSALFLLRGFIGLAAMELLWRGN